jgi:glucosamine--fructose-6-phosphate aminotransferase (isomerizing)
VYLEDGEIAVIDRTSGLKIRNIKNQVKTPFIQELEMQIGGAGEGRLTTTSC